MIAFQLTGVLSGSSKREQLEHRKKKTKFCSKQSNFSSFFKPPSSRDVEAKSILSSSLTLCDVEYGSNSILMVTLDGEETEQASL